MILEINLYLILVAALVTSASPGPATLAIAGTSMARGRLSGLSLASGITLGSLVWSVSAALGLGALMLANAWILEIIRYLGALYLLFLAYKSARSALSKKDIAVKSVSGEKPALFVKGFLLHIANPKAILFLARSIHLLFRLVHRLSNCLWSSLRWVFRVLLFFTAMHFYFPPKS